MTHYIAKRRDENTFQNLVIIQYIYLLHAQAENHLEFFKIFIKNKIDFATLNIVHQ